MTQKDKQLLLLKDLCARLPYELKGRDCSGKTRQMVVIYDTGTILAQEIDGKNCGACGFVPYLRPMSSMTEEEAKEIAILYGLKDILSIKITDEYIDVAVDDGVCSTERWTIWYDEIISSIEIFDWLNRKHFDYRGLIPMGLALEAPEGMYNI